MKYWCQSDPQSAYVDCHFQTPCLVARRLLQAACTGFAEQGLTVAEGNPKPNATTEAANHFGPLELYLSEGFAHHRDDPEDGTVYMRKRLDQ